MAENSAFDRSPYLSLSYRFIAMSYPLTVIMLLLWAEPSGSMVNYCVDQPRDVEVFAGETFTVPCKVVYPEKKEVLSEVAVIWKAHDLIFCGTVDHEIYNSMTNVSFSKYQGRLLMEGDLMTRNMLLILNNVTSKDRNRYCCRVILSFKDKEKSSFQSADGTSLTVRGDNELKLEQPSFIPAFAKDTVTFFVRFTSKVYVIPPFISCRLWRSTWENPKCDRLVYSGDCLDTLRGNILHFKMDHVLFSHRGWYCWEILVSSRSHTTLTFRKALGTELVVVERKNTFRVFQPQEAVFRESVVISCSFTIPQFSNILQKEVYWMIGEPREDYVYHPNPDYIHPDYQGKTSLLNGSNLLLQDFHGLNNTVFYCRVMIQLCGSFKINVTKTEIIMEEGPGTVLKVYDENGPDSILNMCPTSIIIVAGAGLKFILLLLLFILALVYIKKN